MITNVLRSSLLLAFFVAGCGAPTPEAAKSYLAGSADSTWLYLPGGTTPDGQGIFLRQATPIEGNFVLGSADAVSDVVVFADFQCPFCARSNARLAEVRDSLTRAGSVRWIYLDMPLPNHARARHAARIARCAGKLHGAAAFWRTHDALFAQQSLWSNVPDSADAFSAVVPADLRGERLEQCIRDADDDAFLTESFALAVRYGIPGTPTYFVGGLPVGSDLEGEALLRLLGDLADGGAAGILSREGLLVHGAVREDG